MKKLIVCLLSTGLVFGISGYESAAAYDYDAIKDLQTKVKRLKKKVKRNSNNIGDNFTLIQDNRTQLQNLDSRVTDLEISPPTGDGSTRTFVDIDCSENPDVLLSAPINGFFPDNTTYNLSGACNGPLYVTEDGVRFVGVSVDASIVLPAGITNASDGAVFGDGAQDLRFQNLTIDASAWNSGANQGVESAGVYARNAFVRIIDSDVIGGEYGINPFRNATIRLQGTVNVTEFLNVGVSAGDQSVITTRGQVNISSTVTEGNFMTGIEIYRGGNIDFRNGVTVSLPEPTGPLFPFAVIGTNGSHLRVRSAGNVEINGRINMRGNTSLDLQGGNYFSGIDLSQGAIAQVSNIVQIDGGSNNLTDNSVLSSLNSELFSSNIQSGSILRMRGGAIDGLIAQINGMAFLSGVNSTNAITAEKPSFIDFNDGNMNGFSFFFCDEDTTFFDATVTNPVDTCL